MKRLTLYLCMLNSGYLSAQNLNSEMISDRQKQTGIVFSIDNNLTKSGLNNPWFLNSEIGVNYLGENWNFSLSGKLNQDHLFLINQGMLIISLPDSASIQNKKELINRPNQLNIGHPLSIEGSYLFSNLILKASLLLINQSETIEFPYLKELDQDIFYVEWQKSKNDFSQLLLGLGIGYEWNMFQFQFGVQSIPILNAGNKPIHNYISLKPFLWSSALFNYKPFTLKSTVDPVKIKSQMDCNLSFEDFKISPFIVYSSGLGGLNFSSVTLGSSLSVTSKIKLSVSYNNTHAFSSFKNAAEFSKWKKTFEKVSSEPAYKLLDNQSVNIGLTYQLNNEPSPFPLRIISSRFFQPNIFLAKYSFYSFNPIGIIELLNPTDKTVRLNIQVRSTAEIGTYKTDLVEVEAGKISQIPIYLYFDQKKLDTPSKPSQLIVSAEYENNTAEISTFPITFYDLNSWDGDTFELKYFMTPNDPEILTFAKSAFFEQKNLSYEMDSSRWNSLQNFLSTAGRNLKYVSDPTTTFQVDRVQYPTETLKTKSGDCEDLVVFVCSLLMSVGYDCAVLDFRPQHPENISIPTAKSGSLGHVLLLIDTGILAENLSQLNLNELQVVNRKNKLGKTTIWIPFETTIINQGFYPAFLEGLKQYYSEVIEKDGIQKGNVHVYDF